VFITEPSSSKEREMAKAIHRSISNFGVAAGVPDWEWTPQKAEECRLDARHYVLPLSGNLDELEGAAVEVENLAASAEAKLGIYFFSHYTWDSFGFNISFFKSLCNTNPSH